MWMRDRFNSLMAVGSLALTAAAPVAAQTVTTIDVPGATAVTATGINQKAQVVGTYLSPNRLGYPSSFLLNEGRIVLLDVPGAVSTMARSINNNGDIAGTYVVPGDPGSNPRRDRGFLYRQGRYMTVQVPGSAGTRVNALNQRGDLVGEYFEVGPAGDTGPQHGFVLHKDGTLSDVTVPGAVTTKPLSISDAGAIVGVYTLVGSDGALQTHPFLFDGAYERLDVPSEASPFAIAASGDIAGTITVRLDLGFTIDHGFVIRDGAVSSFDVPSGPGHTSVYGMNAKGLMVGGYVGADGVNRGFLLVP